MEYIYALLFGLVGTGLMSFLLYVVGQSGVKNAEFIKGIGSSIPTTAGGSLVPGAIIHVVAGALFGIVYLALGREWGYLPPASLLALGAVVGLAKGVVVSILLGLIAFDQEPLARMAEAGFGVGVCHVVGNVIYGLCVSVLFGVIFVDYAVRF